MKRFQLKSSDFVIGACLLCLIGLCAFACLWPTVAPPDKVVVPVVVAPAEPQEEPQEEPQAAQEEPEAPQGDLSTPALPVPPPSVIEIPVEVIVPVKPVKSGGRCILRYRRGWFR